MSATRTVASYTTAFATPERPMPYRPATATPRAPWTRHPGVIAVAVVGLHVLALWALQTGLLRRAAETVVPAEILVELWNPQPEAAPSPAPVPKPAAQQPAAAAARPVVPQQPAPQLAPSPAVPIPATAPTAVATPLIATPEGNTRASGQNATEAPANSRATATAAPASPKIELPSSDADYLNNPKPPYPALSRRLREQGKVVVRTLIGTDGRAQDAQLEQSSGFERLDQAALKAAREWRYVPGKRDGVPQTMWFNVPFTFQLQ